MIRRGDEVTVQSGESDEFGDKGLVQVCYTCKWVKTFKQLICFLFHYKNVKHMSDILEKWESKPQILNSHVGTIVAFFRIFFHFTRLLFF